ncbi:MAG: hypothetical protein WD398_09065 [Cyclobacteriaceae bacterium]
MKGPEPLVILFLIFTHGLYGQEDTLLQTIPIEEHPPELLVTPSLSANIIAERQWEVNLFNTLVYRDLRNTRITKRPFEEKYDTTISQSQFTRLENILQVQRGLPGRPHLNIGMDFYFSHIRIDEDIHRSPLNIFVDNQNAANSSRNLTAMGPRIRWMPFPALPELTLQGSVVFGINKDLPTRQVYGRDRTQVLTQATFYQRFRPWLYVFLQSDLSAFIKNKSVSNNTFGFPLFLFASANVLGLRDNAYPKLYVLFSGSYSARYDDHVRGKEWLVRRAFESQLGMGLLMHMNQQWGFTFWSQKPIAHDLGSASNALLPGSWNSFNLGIRYTWMTKSKYP